MFPLINYTFTNPFVHSIRDVQSVMAEELYVTEGEVIDAYIERKSNTSINGGSRKSTYYLHIKLNNSTKDEFAIMMDNKEDMVFQIGKTYEIKALPYSRTILEYKEK